MLTETVIFLILTLLLATVNIYIIIHNKKASRRSHKKTRVFSSPEVSQDIAPQENAPSLTTTNPEDTNLKLQPTEEIPVISSTLSDKIKNVIEVNGSDSDTPATVEVTGNKYYDTGMCSEIGDREYQQDEVECLQYPDSDLTKTFITAVLCDGMGGTNCGEAASRFCVSEMSSFLAGLIGSDIKRISMAMIEKLYLLNEEVNSLTDADNNPLKAGTTLIATYFAADKLYWVSVGDSRIYIIRGNQIIQMTVDHIYLNRLMKKVENGEISYEEAMNDRQKDSLTSYIGCPDIEEVDYNIKHFTLMSGDVIMLCSDGLYRNLEQDEIKTIIQNNEFSMSVAAKKLVTSAIEKENPHQDNTSVILIKYL